MRKDAIFREVSIIVAMALLLAVVDLTGAYLLLGRPFASPATALQFLLLATGSLATVLVTLNGGLLAAAQLLRRVGAWAVPVAGGLALAGVTAWLNREFLGRQLLFFVALVGAAAGYGAVLGWLAGRRSDRWQRLAPVALALVAGLLYLVDATQLRGLYFNQHVTLGLFTWLALALAMRLAWQHHLAAWIPGRGCRLALLLPALAALFGTILVWGTPADALSQAIRYVSFSASTSTREAVHLLTRVTDLDCDGYSGLLGRGDCAPLDGTVHPGAVELLGDGVDNNCLAGDVTQDLLAALTRLESRAGSATLPPVRSVILLTVDALRYDRVTGEKAHPFLARLAARGVAFKRAYCLYPGTVPALYSLATSNYPSAVAFTPFQSFEFPEHDSGRTLFEVLSEAGLATFGAMYHLSLSPRFGITRGMSDVWLAADSAAGISSAQTTDQGLAFLEQHGNEPYFLWLHYFDPHAPYETEARNPAANGSDEARYDAEVDRTAAEIERFLNAFEDAGGRTDTLVIFGADHGEEFGEHGNSFHGQTLYDESNRIPLVFLLPDGRIGTVSGPVTTLDLGPTILELLGLADHQPPAWRGQSLVPVLAGEEPENWPPIFLEVFQKGGRHQAYGVLDLPWKLIYVQEDNFFELYNLDDDPTERRNLYDALPDVATALTRLIDLHVARLPQ